MVLLLFTVVACSSLPSNTDRLTIDIAAPSNVNAPSTVMDDAFHEAAAIWAEAGVRVRPRRPEMVSTVASSTLAVFVDDEPGGSTNDGLSLGWIRFNAAGRPESTIHLSRINGLRLLDANAKYRNLPLKAQNILIGRALGRALAHEIGHFLLQSSAHSSVGLMRGRMSFDDFISTSRAGLGLTPSQRESVADRWGFPWRSAVARCVTRSSL